MRCDICDLEFKDRFARYYHKKKGSCKPITLTSVNSHSNAPQNITNITNNNITNNITKNIDKSTTNNIDQSQNVQINYIAFNTPNNDPIEFKTDHIDDPKILKPIFATPEFMDMLTNFTDAVLSAPENRIVQKKNLSRNVAKVYIVERGAWQHLLDQQVFHKMARGVSTSALTLSDKHRKKAQLLPEHEQYLSDIAMECEVSPGAGDADDDLKYSKQTRNAIKTVKVRIHESSS